MMERDEKRSSLGWRWWVLALLVLLGAVAADLWWRIGSEITSQRHYALALDLPSPVDLVSLPTATRFDFPIGSEHGAMVYNAQPFTQNNHLGDDLNGIGGENSDLGDPVFAVADGRVLFAQEGGPGWGNIVIILHAYRDAAGAREYVQSFYAHLQTIQVTPNELVKRGQQIATVGTAGGKYFAHLHFEMREFITPFVGAGYRKDTRGWLNPSEFIATHRGAPDEDVGR